MRLNQRFLAQIKYVSYLCPLLFAVQAQASFIEATMGTAVVNDATATFNNPAALTLLKQSQIIGLGSFATFNTEFTGQAVQAKTGFTQSGSTSTETKYYLPSLYLATPSSEKLTVGLAIISNVFNNSIDEGSVLRYTQSSNRIRNLDILPAIGIKLNRVVSLGAGINFSSANFLLQPITGLPGLNVPDSQSRNHSRGNGVGGDVGVLLQPTPATLIGFNYRSSVTYPLSGTSVFEGTPALTSNDYHFKFWTPAREVLTISQFLTPSVGLIATIQYIQWSIFDEINIRGIATQVGTQSLIVNADVPYHFHDSWLITVGGQYRASPKWIIRAATTYSQSPGNDHYQIVNGDSIILGASAGYQMFKNIIIDGSYAHAFIENQDINISTARNQITGENQGSRDSVSLKLTLNI